MRKFQYVPQSIIWNYEIVDIKEFDIEQIALYIFSPSLNDYLLYKLIFSKRTKKSSFLETLKIIQNIVSKFIKNRLIKEHISYKRQSIMKFERADFWFCLLSLLIHIVYPIKNHKAGQRCS